MDEYYENAVEEIALCEGGSVPLERNRTSELAMECWNLRKTLMEQSSQSVKLKKEIKTLKNLVKSLQRTVTDCEAESLAKTKDIHAQKQQILQCDRKIHELTTASNILNSSYIRSKKLNVNLQRKLEEADRENQQLVEKSNTVNATMKDELRAQESVFSLEIRKLAEERDRALREVAVQKTYVDEAATRVGDLDQSSRELKSEIETQARKYSENLARIAQEQEQSYDTLHARLERILIEREALCRRLVEKEHENHQLMSFVLMEGLQLPELLPAPASLHAEVAEKFPVGGSTFPEGEALTGGPASSAQRMGRCGGGREGWGGSSGDFGNFY